MLIKRIWDFCGGMKLNFWLIIAVSLNLAIGACFIQTDPALFKPLNHSLVQDWFLEYGRHQTIKTWWVVALFALAFFLGTNTFVCAVKRIARLWPHRNQYGFRVFSVKISPSLMHVCFLIILAGHFSSLISGDERNIAVRLNEKIPLACGNSVEAIGQHVERYATPAAFQGSVRQCTVLLKLQSPEKTEIRELRVLSPIHWQDMSIHLEVVMQSGSQETAAPPQLSLIVKNDPGVTPVILCFAIFCLLMFWYFPQRKKHEETGI